LSVGSPHALGLERARLRALERFRKTFELLARGRGTRG
jgi:hypothetical protein